MDHCYERKSTRVVVNVTHMPFFRPYHTAMLAKTQRVCHKILFDIIMQYVLTHMLTSYQSSIVSVG